MCDLSVCLSIFIAARILDPVMIGVNHRELHFGVFFKDYSLTEW